MKNNFLAIFLRDFCKPSKIEGENLVYKINYDYILSSSCNYYVVISEPMNVIELRKRSVANIGEASIKMNNRSASFLETLVELQKKEIS